MQAINQVLGVSFEDWDAAYRLMLEVKAQSSDPADFYRRMVDVFGIDKDRRVAAMVMGSVEVYLHDLRAFHVIATDEILKEITDGKVIDGLDEEGKKIIKEIAIGSLKRAVFYSLHADTWKQLAPEMANAGKDEIFVKVYPEMQEP